MRIVISPVSNAQMRSVRASDAVRSRAPLHWFRSALRRKECFMRFTKIVPKKAWSMQIALMRRQIR